MPTAQAIHSLRGEAWRQIPKQIELPIAQAIPPMWSLEEIAMLSDGAFQPTKGMKAN